MSDPSAAAATSVYGSPPPALVAVSPGAAQFSPLVAGSLDLAEVAPGTLESLAMLAPAGTVERRAVLARMLRALAPGAPFTVLAPKDGGGARLAREFDAFGCPVVDRPKSHHRICSGVRPDALTGSASLDQAALDDAIAEGAPRLLPELGLWSQPGVFSWNRLDPGSALLLDALPALSGMGADFGCGLGVLAHGVLASDAVIRLHLVDLDRRAVDLARRNVNDPRATFLWRDLRQADGLRGLDGLDFVVSNPPFHEVGVENKGLGQLFIARAADALRTGGQLWLVANKHLPYEAAMKPLFKRVTPTLEADGFKILLAVK